MFRSDPNIFRNSHQILNLNPLLASELSALAVLEPISNLNTIVLFFFSFESALAFSDFLINFVGSYEQ